MQGKFGGAVGNYAAHRIAYPDVRLEAFGRKFVRSLGMIPLEHTTQINPHDDLAELSALLSRINTILLNLSRDVWLYISRGVFRQKVIAGEVGSSTMPHKVNPIDFENAEGNVGLSTALFSHFAEKLPVSRLQRDLSDSTVQRNLGVAFGHHLLAVSSLLKGLSKLSIDRAVLKRELNDHPEVLAEAIQTLLRKHGVEDAYEKLKKLTRGAKVSRQALLEFADSLPLTKDERLRLREWPESL
jgi:adenylosuccinate lyase